MFWCKVDAVEGSIICSYISCQCVHVPSVEYEKEERRDYNRHKVKMNFLQNVRLAYDKLKTIVLLFTLRHQHTHSNEMERVRLCFFSLLSSCFFFLFSCIKLCESNLVLHNAVENEASACRATVWVYRIIESNTKLIYVRTFAGCCCCRWRR